MSGYKNSAPDRTEVTLLLAITLVACVLYFGNLGDIYLWQDEAHTANIATTVITTGLPRAYDGVNFFTQNPWPEYNAGYVWKYHPWLQFYASAASMAVFGKGAWQARLPFALFGVMSVLLTYLLVRNVTGNRSAAAFTGAIMSLHVPLILLSRQCRYYAAAVFFSLLAVYAYFMILKSKKGGYPLLILAALLLFHSNFAYLPALAAAVFVHAAIYERKKLIPLLLCAAGTAAVCVPFYYVFYNGGYHDAVTPASLMTKLHKFALTYVLQIVDYVLPAWLAVLALGMVFFKQKKDGGYFREKDGEWSLLAMAFLFAFFVVLVVSLASFSFFFRYIAPAIPFLCVAAGFALAWVFNYSKPAALACLALLAVQLNIFNYFYELTHEYKGPIKGISRYLNEHAKKSDIVVMGYGDQGVKFHTGLQVLLGEGNVIDVEKIKRADWVIPRKHTLYYRDAEAKKIMMKYLNLSDFEPIVLDYPDTMFENRETPYNHMFFTDKNEQGVIIFKRKSKK